VAFEVGELPALGFAHDVYDEVEKVVERLGA
jgi:hypothetical protein